ncbi:hypothetical protein WN51_10651 [Melipona quadrifasciata]|uniref:Uncharacterized protein n=1 Tax=Melipona quadrifasciata TaxID=166423 RepID=A0A0N0BBG8_9HYME|nr:hypothetical protein WN51_10651 [Melipona quadrifasciata]
MFDVKTVDYCRRIMSDQLNGSPFKVIGSRSPLLFYKTGPLLAGKTVAILNSQCVSASGRITDNEYVNTIAECVSRQ